MTEKDLPMKYDEINIIYYLVSDIIYIKENV